MDTNLTWTTKLEWGHSSVICQREYHGIMGDILSDALHCVTYLLFDVQGAFLGVLGWFYEWDVFKPSDCITKIKIYSDRKS